MLKLTKTGIGLLTKQYRSVLRKCLIANLCILYPLTSWAISKTGVSPISGYNYIYEYIYDRYTTNSYAYNNLDINTSLSSTNSYIHGSNFDLEQFVADVVGGEFSYTKAQTDALLNYYYTFRNDKTVESAEFTLFLNNEKLSSVFEA